MVSRTERRLKLLHAAQRAVMKHGADVQLKQVAAEAGLTSGAVLYHFPDVQTLLVEANRAGMERFYDERLRAIEGIAEPDRRLVLTIESGLPVDSDDPAVKLLCELGGAAARYPSYAVLLTALYDRQVAMYQVILESGAAQGTFTLASPSLTVARNIVALEDAYGYRMVARHPSIDAVAATELILDYARVATGHPLPRAQA
ncbi:TetR family transcriptional regulator [Mycolicibacterium fluoranthenivorans]|jgi:AcrR family transcriptional regulator|uniref:TetR family transcriptional regulator n=1 Tax=Mycolicibacterium fluoranthenivorans TaxID=258505 RepID=A0A1G4VAI0_9MYCO|nr:MULTISPECIES: TetR family transcriptional regulator [Mycobacteriaceae]MCV7254782.1 TetR family transcriptional regulator [Mycobacterium hackensackense]QNJ91479.1 TetR family transcriptional regulator [Mycolicibacterium fluoranthenivorans]SCX02925.1 transcriptional regulator, TetR family [Mycolicibacterium fluoranthenivorans]